MSDLSVTCTAHMHKCKCNIQAPARGDLVCDFRHNSSREERALPAVKKDVRKMAHEALLACRCCVACKASRGDPCASYISICSKAYTQAGAATTLGKGKTPATGILVAMIKGLENVPWMSHEGMHKCDAKNGQHTSGLTSKKQLTRMSRP